MERTGPFWDAIEGRVPMPAAAATMGDVQATCSYYSMPKVCQAARLGLSST